MKLDKDERRTQLVNAVTELKEDILQRLQPAAVATATAVVNVRSLSRSSMHAVAAVEIAQNGTEIRFFAKNDLPNYHGPQRLQTEESILRHVAPEIWGANVRTRCPRVLAFFPDHKLLLLEMVEGKSLKELLFDLGWTRSNVAELLALAGEWLGRFHSLTQREQANPFVWLKNAFAEEKIRNTFQRCGVSDLYSPLDALLQQFARDHADFRRPLCQLHTEFTPLHVLVKEDTIYVIDFGASRVGFGYEDAAMFSTFSDGLLPWRAVAGFLRLPQARQKKTFLQSYLHHCGHAFGSPDEIVMGFARLLAMAHHESCWESIPSSWHTGLYSRIGRQWVRRRFAAFARRELAFLKQMTSVPPVWHLDYESSVARYPESITSDSQKQK